MATDPPPAPGPASGCPTAGAPSRDCTLCPRLAAFRADNRTLHPGWHNGPVPSFGGIDAPLLIVGLAPGLRGANRTGRPFTGDFAGDLLFATLLRHGFAIGGYGREADDGLLLLDCRITNAVRCVPPGNRPLPEEVRTCGAFLRAEISGMPELRGILALGAIAHRAVLAVHGVPPARFTFAHGALHYVPDGPLLADSYHCSRQNTNTGRLTPAMFDGIFARLAALLLPAADARSLPPSDPDPAPDRA
jgi:uracil-DNA glycosylase